MTPVYNNTHYLQSAENYKNWRKSYQDRPSFATVAIWTLFVLFVASCALAVVSSASLISILGL